MLFMFMLTPQVPSFHMILGMCTISYYFQTAILQIAMYEEREYGSWAHHV